MRSLSRKTRQSVRLSVEQLADRITPTLLGVDLGSLVQAGPVAAPTPAPSVFARPPRPMQMVPTQVITPIQVAVPPQTGGGQTGGGQVGPPQSGIPDDYVCPPVVVPDTDVSRVTDISYTIVGATGTRTVTDLTDNVQSGDTVTANFTVTEGENPVQVSLVSYTAVSGAYDEALAPFEKVFGAQTGVYTPGDYTLEVEIPDSFFQVDFVTGDILPQLGPSGSANFYTTRLIDADNGGEELYAFEEVPPWEVPGRLTGVSYMINGEPFTTLVDNVVAGAEVSVTFTVTSGDPVKLSLVSYSAPTPDFDATVADQQEVFDGITGTFGPGTYTIQVTVPETCFQVDFVSGDIIPELGPLGSPNFYSSLGRQLSVDSGPGPIDCGCDGDGDPGELPEELPEGGVPTEFVTEFVTQTVMVETPATVTAPGQDLFAVGAAPGGSPLVRVFDSLTGTLRAEFLAYSPNFTGGVRVATGDVDGDGFDDVITAAGPGASPHIKVYSGQDFSVIRSFYAYDPAFIGGVTLAAGDVNGDGFADIITGSNLGASHVKVFDGQTGAEIRSFYAYGSTFQGGVRVSAGDVDGDGLADIVTGTSEGAPHVKAFSGQNGSELLSLFAFDAGFDDGIWVAAGDVDGDGIADIAASLDEGGPAVVRVFDGKTGAQRSQFDAFGGFLGGVRLATTDFGGDGRADIVAGAGAGSTRVRVLDGLTGGGLFDDVLLSGSTTGVFVG